MAFWAGGPYLHPPLGVYRLRILILSPRFPHAAGKADSMTVYRLVRYLAQRHEIYLACFYERPEELEHLPGLEACCREVKLVRLRKAGAVGSMVRHVLDGVPLQTAYYASVEMRNVVEDLLARVQPELAYAHLIRMAEYLRSQKRVKRVLALQISQTLNYRRMIEHIRIPFYRVLYGIEYRKVLRYEPAIMRDFDSCLLISPHDKQAIAGHERLNNVFYSPHGVDVAYYTPRTRAERERAILFCGVLETPTNIDAALWFHREIYPLIQAQYPEVRLYLAGKSPVRAIRRLAERDPSVVVTGFVKDLRDYYERIGVGVDPLRIGAGLQNKLLIGMSMMQPMVCTSIANEGIGAESGRHLLIADEPRAFADAVVALLSDDELAARIAREARAFVEEAWTWEYHLAHLEAHLNDVAGRSA